jgi:molybdopterin molybdotransferase
VSAPAGQTQFDSPADAVAALAVLVQAVGTERIPLAEATGRVLAEAICADRPSPAVDVSAMDGYAVRLSSLGAGRRAVAGDIAIGRAPPSWPGAGVLRIVTGAPVPEGADAVVKREDVEEHGEAITISGACLASLRAGMNIRRRGENCAAGDEVVAAGREIDAPAAGALASFGRALPCVFRRVRVGVLVTGDEVIEASSSPSPWQIRDSNGSAVAALLGRAGWLQVAAARRAVDEPGMLRDAVSGLLDSCDAIVMTGGVSMGPKDFVPGVLAGLGARVVFHRVPQRPGKPVLGAVLPGGQPVLALPGNPVSVMVTARRMAVPILARLAGLSGEMPPAQVRLSNADGKRLNLWWHRPVRIGGLAIAELIPGMGSGDVASVARSDGFVEVPPEQAGEGPWPFYPWRI